MNRLTIRNTSRYPDAVVKALVNYARDGRDLGELSVTVTNCRGWYRGRFTPPSRVFVRVGAPGAFPTDVQYPGKLTAPKYTLADWQETIVAVAAHEFTHRMQWLASRMHRMQQLASRISLQRPSIEEIRSLNIPHPGRKRVYSEIEAERAALRTLERFRADRPPMGLELLEARERVEAVQAVEAAQAARAAKKTPQAKLRDVEARIAKTEEATKRWERKLKLAETKLKKLRRSRAALTRSRARFLSEATAAHVEELGS